MGGTVQRKMAQISCHIDSQVKKPLILIQAFEIIQTSGIEMPHFFIMHDITQFFYAVIMYPGYCFIIEKNIRTLGTQPEKIPPDVYLVLKLSRFQVFQDVICKKAVGYKCWQELLLSDMLIRYIWKRL